MNREQGKKHSRYFGAEYYANRDDADRSEYIESCVMAYDESLTKIRNLPHDIQTELLAAFNQGIEDEKRAIGEIE